MKQLTYYITIALLVFFIITMAFDRVEAHTFKPSGELIKGKKPSKVIGKFYTIHSSSSPPVTDHTKAIMTINSFEKGGEGGGPSECDNKYHSNKSKVVALSTGWFNHMKRCHKFITIHANGKSVDAMVVDECDSSRGCKNNIVDASEAVWKALDIPKKDWGWLEVFWADA